MTYTLRGRVVYHLPPRECGCFLVAARYNDGLISFISEPCERHRPGWAGLEEAVKAVDMIGRDKEWRPQ